MPRDKETSLSNQRRTTSRERRFLRAKRSVRFASQRGANSGRSWCAPLGPDWSLGERERTLWADVVVVAAERG